MKKTRLIGRECKYSNVLSGPILICRGLDYEIVKVEPSGSFFCGSFEGAMLSKKNNPVVMAKGIHLFPSRTQ